MAAKQNLTDTNQTQNEWSGAAEAGISSHPGNSCHDDNALTSYVCGGACGDTGKLPHLFLGANLKWLP